MEWQQGRGAVAQGRAHAPSATTQSWSSIESELERDTGRSGSLTLAVLVVRLGETAPRSTIPVTGPKKPRGGTRSVGDARLAPASARACSERASGPPDCGRRCFGGERVRALVDSI